MITADPDRVAPVNRAIRAALPDVPVRVIDWTQSNNSFFAAVEVERNVMFLILTLIILVAAFNIVSSLIMMVKDKTRDIAVLRTLGRGAGRDHAHFPAVRRERRRGGDAGWGAARASLFCLNIETIRQWLQGLTGTNLFNPEVYFLSRLPAVRAVARGGAGGRHGAGAVAAGHAVSELAGGAHRSGRGAAP